ncbi:MAG TPA: ABC transporter substrate-binding protein [Pseudonocardiaceae bacterium]
MRAAWTVLALLAVVTLTGCGAGPSPGDTVNVVVGYQSKTINTVTAGTLLRSLGYFEQRLRELGQRTGKNYSVTWQDYDTGAPITAQMIADKIDIGSMGDYPLLINGSRTQAKGPNGTRMVSVTGYNLRGALNMVVVSPQSDAQTLRDLQGKKVSTSVGSAAHGTLVQALRAAGVDPVSGVHVENQQPSVGASALQGGNVAGLSQFVAWPGALVFAKAARLLYDGAQLNVPTLHGVVVRNPFATEHPDVLDAFLRAQLDATRYLHEHPLAAAQNVAQATGLPAEVVYLYNGPNGIATFDPTIKPPLREALKRDVPFLASIGNIKELNVDAFINDSHLRRVYGPAYDTDLGSTANPSRISGTDSECGRPVDDPASAGEIWLQGEDSTHPAATPTCLLKFVRSAQAAGKKVRVAYVPDASTGTRWFADHMVWVDDRQAAAQTRFLPFATEAGARDYLRAHPGAVQMSYPDAAAAA